MDPQVRSRPGGSAADLGLDIARGRVKAAERVLSRLLPALAAIARGEFEMLGSLRVDPRDADWEDALVASVYEALEQHPEGVEVAVLACTETSLEAHRGEEDSSNGIRTEQERP